MSLNASALSEADEAEYLALLEAEDLAANYYRFAHEHLKIRSKSGAIIPLELNRAQRHVDEALNAQLEKTGKVRALLLKARQQGFSTYVGSRFYHKASHQVGQQVFILTHEDDATNNLFGMVERFHEHNDAVTKPTTSADNAKELRFDALDSGYSVGTAGAKARGRSKTVQLFHGSEVAFWPNAPTHFAGVVQAIPDLPGTEIILESTANGVGGEFHERWQQAESGIGDYIPIFVPWFWSDEYRRPVPEGFTLSPDEQEYADLYDLDHAQMAWRRAKLAELKDPMLFMQEYPATAAEAFQTTGHDSFIKAADVLKARKARIEPIGPLVIGVDPMREGGDRFAIAWRKGRTLTKLESFSDPITTLHAATKLKDIIDTDKPVKMFIDAGGGAGIYDVLVSWGYGHIVVLVNFGSAPIHPPKTDDKGKPLAGPKNRRAEMWSLSRDWLTGEGGADIPDKDSLQVDACGPKFRYDTTTSQLVLESKREMKKRGVRSPDEWDAVVLTFAEPVKDPDRPRPPRPVARSGSSWMGA
jgi:hypothetical protein